MTETQYSFLYGDPQLGRTLRSIRESKEINKQDIMNALDFTEEQFARYERGDAPLSLTQLSSWLNLLGVSPNLFFALYDLDAVEHEGLIS